MYIYIYIYIYILYIYYVYMYVCIYTDKRETQRKTYKFAVTLSFMFNQFLYIV